MTRTQTIQIYQFNELNEEAQERAMEWFRERMDNPWQAENRVSLEAFANIFPVKIGEWEYGGGRRNFVNFEMSADEEILSLKGKKLAKYIKSQYGQYLKGNCPLTGYCMDEALFDPIREFLKNPHADIDFENVMYEALNTWARRCSEELEYQYSDEAVRESIISNDYEFLENGQKW